MSSSNCCFLTCIQISQEAGQVVWYSHFLKNFPQFIVIHTVKGFGIVNRAEIDVFLEFSCFFDDPADVGNLISASSALTLTLRPCANAISKCMLWVRGLMQLSVLRSFLSLINSLLKRLWFFRWSCMYARVGLWRKLSAEELMLLNCGVGEVSWESLGLQGDPTSPFWRRSALGFLWKEWC